jgi:hypothetical protein
MKKKPYRDYAISAFQLYAREGSLRQYEDKIRRQAKRQVEEDDKGFKQSHGSPVEAQAMRTVKAEELAEKMLEVLKATLCDLYAVEETIRMLEHSGEGGAKMTALKTVYMQNWTYKGKNSIKNETEHRVNWCVINIPASRRTIFRWLNDAIDWFATERGLRRESLF